MKVKAVKYQICLMTNGYKGIDGNRDLFDSRIDTDCYVFIEQLPWQYGNLHQWSDKHLYSIVETNF